MPITDISKQLSDLYAQYAKKDFELTEEEGAHIENLGKIYLDSGEKSTITPKGVSFKLWDGVKHFLKELSQADVHGSEIRILGFLPIWFVHERGEVCGFKYNQSQAYILEGAIASSFNGYLAEKMENIKLNKFIITYDQLVGAGPEHLYDLKKLIMGNIKDSEYWTAPDCSFSDAQEVHTLYLPFVIYMDAQVPEDFHFTDIFNENNLNEEVPSYVDILWQFMNPQGEEFDAFLQYGPPCEVEMAIDDGELQKDLVKVEVALNDIRETASEYEHGLAVKVNIEVYWPVGPDQYIPLDMAPTIRVSIYKRVINDPENDVAGEYDQNIINVHIPETGPHDWHYVLSQVLKLCYTRHFTSVSVLQHASSNLLDAWQRVTGPTPQGLH